MFTENSYAIKVKIESARDIHNECVCVCGGGGGGGECYGIQTIMFVFVAKTNKTTIERILSLFDVTVS